MEQEKEKEVSLDKVYELPCFSVVKYKNYYLAIAAELAKWIILENDQQLGVFHMLQDRSTLEEVLKRYKEDDVVCVLTQIEAKQIENTVVKSVFANTRLHLHLTNRCNMHCPHCYMESGTEYEDELTTEEIKKLCKDFYAAGGTDVSLTGGEPTVHPDFFDIVEYISGLGMKVSIYSNGWAWNEESVRRISSQNIEGVQISIDGFDEQSNSTIRGKGAFERALNAIDLFMKHNVYVKVAITAPYGIIRDHKKEYISFSRSLLDKYNGSGIEINYSYFFMRGRELKAEDILQFRDDYYKIIDEVVTGIYGDTAEDSFVSNISNCVYDSCGYGSLNVAANGDFYFCDRIPDVAKSGNIRSMHFDDVFKLMKVAEEAGKIDHFKPCKDCELKYICGGGCRVEKFKKFTSISDVLNIDYDSIEARECSKKDKEKYYDLMVRTNERFFC